MASSSQGRHAPAATVRHLVALSLQRAVAAATVHVVDSRVH